MSKAKIIYKSLFLRGNELITGLLTAKGSPYGFTPVEGIEPGMEWINPDRLYALWRIGYCLGDLKPESYTGKLQVYFRLSKESLVLLQLDPQGFIVSKANGTDFMSGGLDFIKLKNGLNIVWSKEMTCLDVDTFIAEVHYFARMKGSMIGNTLKLKEDVVEMVPALLKVDEVFSLCTLAGPFDAKSEDKDILDLFDQPALLSIITTSPWKWVVLTSQKEAEEGKLTIRLNELKAEGIDFENIDAINMQKIVDLCIRGAQ